VPPAAAGGAFASESARPGGLTITCPVKPAGPCHGPRPSAADAEPQESDSGHFAPDVQPQIAMFSRIRFMASSGKCSRSTRANSASTIRRRRSPHSRPNWRPST
jgi:hypothetical protein